MPKQNNKEFIMLFILTILYIISNLRKRVSVHRILWIFMLAYMKMQEPVQISILTLEIF